MPIDPTPRVVLLVEDDADIRLSICELLEDEGYVVKTASNGQEALDYLRGAPPPALMLLDLHMPVLDGWAFIEERRRDPMLAAIPVVVVSASGGGSRLVPGAGIAALLAKPVSPDALLEAVSQHGG